MDEYCLAEPDPRRQEQNGMYDVSRDSNVPPDRRPTLERRRNMFHATSRREDRLFSGPRDLGAIGRDRSPFI